MKPCFKVKNQNLIHGDFTKVNVTYWGVHSKEKKVKENNNNKKCHFMETSSYSASFFGKTADTMKISLRAFSSASSLTHVQPIQNTSSSMEPEWTILITLVNNSLFVTFLKHFCNGTELILNYLSSLYILYPPAWIHTA